MSDEEIKIISIRLDVKQAISYAEHATIEIVGKVDVAMIEQYEKERWT